MKAILNPKFQKNVVTNIEDFYSDEYLQVADEEYHIIDQTLEEIQEELRHKGKKKMVEFEIGTCSKPSDIEEDSKH